MCTSCEQLCHSPSLVQVTWPPLPIGDQGESASIAVGSRAHGRCATPRKSWILEVDEDGDWVVLDGLGKVKIESVDSFTVMDWLETEDVLVTADRVIRIDPDNAVQARRVDLTPS